MNKAIRDQILFVLEMLAVWVGIPLCFFGSIALLIWQLHR